MPARKNTSSDSISDFGLEVIQLGSSGGLRPTHEAKDWESATVTDRRYSIELPGRVFEPSGASRSTLASRKGSCGGANQLGVSPKGNANFAWVQHFIHHLAPQGMAGFVLANGSMSSNLSGEGDIRKASNHHGQN